MSALRAKLAQHFGLNECRLCLEGNKGLFRKAISITGTKGAFAFCPKTRTHMILFPSMEGDGLSKINEEITTTQKIKEEIKTALASGVPYLLNQKRWRQKIRGKK